MLFGVLFVRRSSKREMSKSNNFRLSFSMDILKKYPNPLNIDIFSNKNL